MPIGTNTPPPPLQIITQKKMQFFFFFHFRCTLLQISYKKCFLLVFLYSGVPGLKETHQGSQTCTQKLFPSNF